MKSKKVFIVLFACICLIAGSSPLHTKADLVDELKSKIGERNKTIAELEKEIAQYEAQVVKTSEDARSLKDRINNLELTRKKLSTEISLIENKIGSTNLTIKELELNIAIAEDKIDQGLKVMANNVEQINEQESDTLVEIVINNKSISSFLNKVESQSQLSTAIKAKLKEIRQLKSDLSQKKVDMQNKRQELISLASDLSDKKKVAEYNKNQTNTLLIQTKNQEAEYRKSLLEKKALRDAFAKELLDFESQLKYAIDPSSIPKTASGVLRWPLENVKITQPFGDTDFARSHTQAYNGRGHNGIDLKASIGTKVMASLSGKIVGTGNTDSSCPNASYGRWILIEHDNGLSTMYAHLSVIKVSAGDQVATGDLIGYSGDSGYATGPHLHFTVYATQGVKIMSRASKSCKKAYTMPIGSLNAYLNPLLYL